MGGTLQDIAARHVGDAPGDRREACPNCAKPGRDQAVNITVNDDGSVVAHCHRCGENGTARPAEHVNGSRRPAARFRATPPAATEDLVALMEFATKPGETLEHPYLQRKQVEAYGRTRISGELLLIPMTNMEHELVGVQKIDAAGGKLYAKGSRKTGAFFAITSLQNNEDAIIITEGYATGASIFAAATMTTVIAFDAGNLVHVSRVFRAKYPAATIIIAADDDIATKGNPGLTAATAAARAVGGLVALPDFGANRPNWAKDFNDLAIYCGADAVRASILKAIEKAKAPEPDEPQPDADRDSERAEDRRVIVGGALSLALAMDDLEFVASPILTKGQKGSLTAHPGHGKSTFGVGLCVHHALGRVFGPITPEADGLACFVSVEDLHGTRNKILGEAARLRLNDADRSLLDARLRWVHAETSATAPAIYDAIVHDTVGEDVSLIFIDTGPALFCGDDENDNIALRNFVEGFAVMAKLPGNPATVLAWHPSKGATADRLEPRGASAIKAVCDFCLTLWKEDDRVTLGYTKVRGQHFDPIEGKLSAVELVAASGARYFAPVVTLDADERVERADAREAREAILKRMYSTRATPATVRDLATAAGISRAAVGRHLVHLATAQPRLATKDPVDDRYTLTKAGEARAKVLVDQSKEAYAAASNPG